MPPNVLCHFCSSAHSARFFPWTSPCLVSTSAADLDHSSWFAHSGLGLQLRTFHTFALSQHDSRCCIPCLTSPVPQFNKDPSFSSSSMGKQHISGAFSAPVHWIGKTTSHYLSFMQRAQVHSPAKHGVHSSLFSHESWGPPCGQYTRDLYPWATFHQPMQ